MTQPVATFDHEKGPGRFGRQLLPSHYHTTIPYHTMPYHTIPYHAIPCHTTPYHAMVVATVDHTPHHTTPHPAIDTLLFLSTSGQCAGSTLTKYLLAQHAYGGGQHMCCVRRSAASCAFNRATLMACRHACAPRAVPCAHAWLPGHAASGHIRIWTCASGRDMPTPNACTAYSTPSLPTGFPLCSYRIFILCSRSKESFVSCVSSCVAAPTPAPPSREASSFLRFCLATPAMLRTSMCRATTHTIAVFACMVPLPRTETHLCALFQ